MSIRDNRGGALMLAVGYLAIMTIAASGFLAMLHQRMSIVRDQERIQWSRHLAEAGIEAALASLDTDAAYRGESEVPLGMGCYSVRVTPTEDATYLIESTGDVVYDGVVMERHVLRVLVAFSASGDVDSLEWNVEPRP